MIDVDAPIAAVKAFHRAGDCINLSIKPREELCSVVAAVSSHFPKLGNGICIPRRFDATDLVNDGHGIPTQTLSMSANSSGKSLPCANISFGSP